MADYNLKTPERPVGLLQAVEKLMYWAQVSLPAVYGEELTYAKEQGKMAAKINEVVEQLNVNTEWTEYLLNEGVETETIVYINELLNNGTLASLINNELLRSINNQVEINKNNITSLQTSKADKSEIGNIISGTVKGVYDNLAALQAAYPNGAQGIYVTSDNGHWYYYNDGWKDGGVYNSYALGNQLKYQLGDYSGYTISNTRVYFFKNVNVKKGTIVIMTNPNYWVYVGSADGQTTHVTYTTSFYCYSDFNDSRFGVRKRDNSAFTQLEAEKALSALIILGDNVDMQGDNIPELKNLLNHQHVDTNYNANGSASTVMNTIPENGTICMTYPGWEVSLNYSAPIYPPSSVINTPWFSGLFVITPTINHIGIRFKDPVTNTYVGNGDQPFPFYILNKNSELMSYEDVQRLKQPSHKNLDWYYAGTNRARIIYPIPNIGSATKIYTTNGFQIAPFNGNNALAGWGESCDVNIPNITNYAIRKNDNSLFDYGEVTDNINFYNGTEIGINESSTTASGLRTVYVNSQTGNDDYSGSAPSVPKKTINAALLNGDIILCRAGDYFETIALSDRQYLYIGSDQLTSYSADVENRPLVNIINGEEITVNQSGNLLTCSYTPETGSRFDNVFINKSLAPIVEGRSEGYNATINAYNGNFAQSKSLKPVLTIEEVQATKGTFTLINNLITINPFDGSDFRYFIPSANNNSFLRITNLTLEDCNFIGGYDRVVAAIRCNNLLFNNCRFSMSALLDGLGLDFTNGTLNNCISFANRNDGFNIHYYGETHFNNCSGLYNRDDGISHHEGTVGFINGGEWAYSGKGGISPTYGSIVNCQGVYTHDNNFGLYQINTNDHPARNILWEGCCAVNNITDIRISKDQVVGINCVYKTKNVDAGGQFTEYGSTVLT